MHRLLIPLLTAGLVAVPALPAAAAPGADVVVYEAGGTLYRAAADFSAPQVLGQEGGQVTELSAAGDGSRFAYVVATLGQPGYKQELRTRVVVRDVSGRTAAVVDDRIGHIEGGDVFTGESVETPSLSYDGNRVLWQDPSGWVTAAVAGGDTSPLTSSKERFRQAHFVGPQDDVLAVGTVTEGTSYHDALVQVRSNNVSAVAGISGPAYEFAVSPDGGTIAYQTFVTGDEHARLNVAPLLRSVDGTISAGPSTTLTTDFQDDTGPRFSHDGSTVYWATPDRDIVSVPVTGGPVSQRTTTPDRLESVAVGMAQDDGTAPAAVTVQPFRLLRLTVELRWTLPTDADLSGVLIQATTSSGYRYEVAFVPTPATSYQQFAYGSATYAFFAVDRSGHQSALATRGATTITTFAHFPSLVSTTGTGPAFAVTLPGSSARNSLWYRPGPGAPLTLLLDRQPVSTYVFDRGVPGGQYGFLVQSTDEYGNSTDTVGAGIAVVPYDQNRATFSGSYVTQARSDRWLGSAVILRTAESAARFTATGRSVQVIGERCSSCGVVDVYVDGVRVAGVDTYSAIRKPRAVLLSRALTGAGSHAVVLKVRGTSGHPWVVVDGIAVQH